LRNFSPSSQKVTVVKNEVKTVGDNLFYWFESHKFSKENGQYSQQGKFSAD